MGQMNEGTFNTLYDYGKMVYSGEMSLNEAVEGVHLKCPEVAISSATHYITWYSKMRTGDYSTWNSNSKLLLLYVKRIIAEEGPEVGKLAVKSARLFARYVSRQELENDLIQLSNANGVELLDLVSHNFTPDDKDQSTMYEMGEQEVTVGQSIEKIKEYITAAGFTYPDGMIKNFWLSLKSKPFVILAGTSGTGKTRLVRLFAEAVGATTENGRYKLVSVRPDWSDSSDLFGHVDLNGRVVPGAIIDFIKKAEWNPEYPFFLCLDEMNLARVEYYLSDFLSVMETRERKDGHIVTDPLVDLNYYGSDTAAAGKYGRVILPDNLYVIGTVNMDETTFPFSKKVLDRANTIEFSYVKLNALPADTADLVVPLQLGNDFLKTEYLTLKECMAEDANFQSLCDRLEAVNTILAKAGAHVGYRVRDEIVFYLMNNKKNDLLPEETAFDNEIMQKILPRIQGSSSTVRALLCDLFRFCAGDYTGLSGGSDSEQMQQYLEQKGAGKYPESAKKIVFMTRRFEEDGFTSYWL